MNEEKKEALPVDEKSDGGAFYTHKFKLPFEWEGKAYKEMAFDFGRLRGKDSVAIEHELAVKGKAVIMPAASVDYLIAMAARASDIGADVLEALPLKDFNKIRSKARSFLLSTEL